MKDFLLFVQCCKNMTHKSCWVQIVFKLILLDSNSQENFKQNCYILETHQFEEKRYIFLDVKLFKHSFKSGFTPTFLKNNFICATAHQTFQMFCLYQPLHFQWQNFQWLHFQCQHFCCDLNKFNHFVLLNFMSNFLFQP